MSQLDTAGRAAAAQVEELFLRVADIAENREAGRSEERRALWTERGRAISALMRFVSTFGAQIGNAEVAEIAREVTFIEDGLGSVLRFRAMATRLALLTNGAPANASPSTTPGRDGEKINVG